jgi:hypothetical protein
MLFLKGQNPFLFLDFPQGAQNEKKHFEAHVPPLELPKMPCRCDANRAFTIQEKTANLFVPVHKTRARV